MASSIFSEKRFLFFTVAWWLALLAMQFVILRQAGVDGYYAFIDALSSNVLLGALCFVVSNNMRFYLPRKDKYWYILVSSLVICLIWLILLLSLFNLIFPKNDPYIDFLKESSGLRFGAGFLIASILTMFSLVLYSQQEQEEFMARQTEIERLSKEAELFRLRQQLHPHFLFNSLNSISSLIAGDPPKARHMVQQLSDFLRGMLKEDDQKMIPLAEELHNIRLYLDIEKVRFGHRLQTEIDHTAEAEKCLVPPMILQPVVENAIKFGLYDTTGDVLITIHAERKDNHLIISVRNPFDPETSRPVAGTGFGISSISRRLFLVFSRKNLISTSVEGDYFTTKILIPQP